jgi:hypothetical protein
MALNPSGAISLAGPSAGQSIAVELGVSATATISLNDTNVRTLAGVASGVIVMPTDFYGKSSITNTQRAIFGFSSQPPALGITSTTNLVSNTGVVASDTPGVGTARYVGAAASYGGDKAIFGFGVLAPGSKTNITNLVSNTGVVASNTPGVGTGRESLAATGYGGDKAIFGLGDSAPTPQFINYVSNTGVVASDTAVTGTIKQGGAGVVYGGDKGMFAYGIRTTPAPTTLVNSIYYVSNTGVFEAIVPGVGTARNSLAASTYGGDKAIFGFGSGAAITNITNLVSNTGVVATDTPGVGTVRLSLAGAGYGGDKGIFGFGTNPALSPAAQRTLLITNLVSNTGVVASDTPTVATRKSGLSAAGYSTSP